jgi:hypothetical protein
MEFLMFGAVNLVAIVLFVVATAVPFVVFNGIGKKMALNTGYKIWRLLPVGVLTAVGLWLSTGLVVFNRACNAGAKIEVISKIHEKPLGFKVFNDRFSLHNHAFDWRQGVYGGSFQFADYKQERICADSIKHKDGVQYLGNIECDKTIQSQIAVYVLPEKKISYWWMPPVYQAPVEVRDDRNGKLVAKSADVIFGGGILSAYMRLLGGDQDFDYLSCGHASMKIGPWRPTLTSRPRSGEYDRADLALLLAAFVQP